MGYGVESLSAFLETTAWFNKSPIAPKKEENKLSFSFFHYIISF
uniref:Uncharacterized protein n=1 Tax=Anguilla anguilla TaxID=7936 RepID=A0A0E9SJ59_ANGAN